MDWSDFTQHSNFLFHQKGKMQACCLWPLWSFSVTISKCGMWLLHESAIPPSCHPLNVSHRDEHRNRVLGLQWRAAQRCITSGLFGHTINSITTIDPLDLNWGETCCDNKWVPVFEAFRETWPWNQGVVPGSALTCRSEHLILNKKQSFVSETRTCSSTEWQQQRHSKQWPG